MGRLITFTCKMLRAATTVEVVGVASTIKNHRRGLGIFWIMAVFSVVPTQEQRETSNKDAKQKQQNEEKAKGGLFNLSLLLPQLANIGKPAESAPFFSRRLGEIQ